MCQSCTYICQWEEQEEKEQALTQEYSIETMAISNIEAETEVERATEEQVETKAEILPYYNTHRDPKMCKSCDRLQILSRYHNHQIHNNNIRNNNNHALDMLTDACTLLVKDDKNHQ